MTSQPDIRIATQADFDSLARIYVAASFAVDKRLHPNFYDGYEDDFIIEYKTASAREHLSLADSCLNQEIFVSTYDSGITGFGMFIHFILNDVKHAEIRGLYVDPDHQKKGIGVALFNYACKRLATYDKVLLHCDGENTDIHEWYKKRGVLSTGHFAKMPERYHPPTISIMRVPANVLSLHRS